MTSDKKSPIEISARQSSLAPRSEKLVARGLRQLERIESKATSLVSANEDIHAAALYGDIGTLQRILEMQPERAVEVDEDSLAPLHYAAYSGRDTTVRILLEFGADVNQTDRWANTALFYGAKERGTSVVQALLCAGADPNHINEDGEPVLDRSLSVGRVYLTERLFDFDPDESALQLSFFPPHRWRYWRGSDAEVVFALVKGGAHISESDAEFLTACESAAAVAPWPKTKRDTGQHDTGTIADGEGRAGEAQVTVSTDPAWEGLVAETPDLEWPLHHAAGKGLVGSASFLIAEAGCDVNWRTPSEKSLRNPDKLTLGATPLAYALSPAIMILLLRAGADPNARWGIGHTKLLALFNNLENRRTIEELAPILIGFGADPNTCDDEGRSILETLWSISESELSEYLDVALAIGVDPNGFASEDSDELPFLTSLILDGGDNDLIERLLEAGADPESNLGNGFTPMLAAQWSERPDIVELLEQYGAQKHSDEEVSRWGLQSRR